MRLEATNKDVRGGLDKPPPLPGRVKRPPNIGDKKSPLSPKRDPEE